MVSEFVFELYRDDYRVYMSTDINYVFHEYLNYMNEKNDLSLTIKKKLQDNNKKYPLYLETIKYNSSNMYFYSLENNNIYQINNVTYLINLVNLTKTDIPVKEKSEETKIMNKKLTPIIKTKIKVIDYDTNIKKQEDNKEPEPESDIDEEKLAELEKMIKHLEVMKDENLNKLKETEEKILNTDMENRFEKSKERAYIDKKKELNNIFEADKRLYYKFKEIHTEIEKQKKDIEEGNIDRRRPSELKKHELTAKILIKNNKEFEIPILFKHKHPIFYFMDYNNLLEDENSFLVFKIIYYTNYELNTESRKYFGDEVYLLSQQEKNIYEEDFTDDEKTMIKEFTEFIGDKRINIEKLISDSINNSEKNFFQNLKNNMFSASDRNNTEFNEEYNSSSSSGCSSETETESSDEDESEDEICVGE